MHRNEAIMILVRKTSTIYVNCQFIKLLTEIVLEQYYVEDTVLIYNSYVSKAINTIL